MCIAKPFFVKLGARGGDGIIVKFSAPAVITHGAKLCFIELSPICWSSSIKDGWQAIFCTIFFSLTIQCKIYLKNPHNVESHVLRNIKKLYFPSQKPQIHPNFSHQKIEKISWILLNFHAKILEASRTNISKFKAGQKTNEFPFKIVCKNYEIVPVSVVKTKWQASEIPVDLSSDWQVTSSRSAWWTRDKNLWKISTILSYPKLLPTPTLWPNFQLIHPCGEM